MGLEVLRGSGVELWRASAAELRRGSDTPPHSRMGPVASKEGDASKADRLRKFAQLAQYEKDLRSTYRGPASAADTLGNTVGICAEDNAPQPLGTAVSRRLLARQSSRPLTEQCLSPTGVTDEFTKQSAAADMLSRASVWQLDDASALNVSPPRRSAVVLGFRKPVGPTATSMLSDALALSAPPALHAACAPRMRRKLVSTKPFPKAPSRTDEDAVRQPLHPSFSNGLACAYGNEALYAKQPVFDGDLGFCKTRLC